MRQHAVVQAHAARQKPLRLGIVHALDQAYELRHDVEVIPGWTETILDDQPARWKEDKVDIGGALRFRWGGQHREDRRIRMVLQNRTYRRKLPQGVFVGRVVAVPSDHVERRVIQLRDVEFPAPFHSDAARDAVTVLIGSDRRQEVAPVRETIRADRPALGTGELCAVILADITASRSVEDKHLELDATRNNRDLSRADVDDTHFSEET